MIELRNNKLTFVLMAGLPGAGKTTLSIELGRELKWHVINKDRHKAILLGIGLDDWTAGNAAYVLSFDTAREILASRRSSVILDTSALHTFILDQVSEIIRCIENVRLKVILCVADRDLRNYRLRTRPVQLTAIRVDPETIADYFQQFKHLPSEPERLTLFTNHPLKKCLDEAIEYLMS